MSLGHSTPSRPEREAPPTDKGKMALAGVLLVIPIIALLWVPSYAKEGPALWGFPFFFWYQFLWVFICSGMTYTAYRLTLSARGKTTHKVGEGK